MIRAENTVQGTASRRKLGLPISAIILLAALTLKLSPIGLWFLVTVQYALADLDGPDAVAALHPVNALLIFWVSLSIAGRSWRGATGQTKG